LACGYGGGVGALKRMGADKMGLSDEELLGIIRRWRAANKRIVDFWYTVENAVLEVMRTGAPVGVKNLIFAREMDARTDQDFLTITLPSGRKLYYVKPFLLKNDRGREALHFWGVDQDTKKWGVVSTYGGKLVENITQAIARDCLAESIVRLTHAGYPILFHVHDEVIVEVLKETAHKDLEEVFAAMGQPISWAPGLLLKADGFTTDFYKKE
jgi:DNA polymerase